MRRGLQNAIIKVQKLGMSPSIPVCILDLEESEVTNDGTQEFGEMIRTAVVRGLTASWDGSFLIFQVSLRKG